MDEALWYYEDGGRPAGPVSEAALAEAIRQGRLARGQRVWTAGQAGWLAWEAIPRLAALAPAAEPSAPPAVPPGPPVGDRPAAPGGDLPQPTEPGPGWSPPPRPAGAASAGPLRLYPRAPLGARFLAAVLDGLISGGPLAVAVGALAFTASDVSVARDRFVRHEFLNRAWGLPLYYAAQVLLAPVTRVAWQEADALTPTARGAGGFGHSGV